MNQNLTLFKTFKQIKTNAPSENLEQITVFNWLRINHPDVYKLAFHPKNEGLKTKVTAMNDKVAGLKAGVSDIIILSVPPIIIELKKASKQARLSKEQETFLNDTAKAGCYSFVCFGHEPAIAIIDELVKRKKIKY